MKIHLVLVALLCFHTICHSQTCEQFPADCPDEGMIESARDSEVCISNLIAPQEITMQNRLRVFITAMMNDLANEKKWQVYELTEMHGAGIGIEGNTKILPYPLRPPY